MERLFFVVGLCGFFAVTGCSSLGLKSTTVITQESVGNRAAKCLCLWQQAQGSSPTGQTTRGFAGQVFFMPREGDVPVAVQGQVRLYLFDDNGSAEQQARPIHEVDLSNDEWQATLTSTQFGPAYNVFVPYVRPGLHETNCALRLRLTRPDGSLLFSDLATVKLVGTSRVTTNEPKDEQPRIRRDELRSDGDGESSLRTTTIGVEDDGRLHRSVDRVRYMSDGSSARLSTGMDHADLLQEMEEKLARLKAQRDDRHPESQR